MGRYLPSIGLLISLFALPAATARAKVDPFPTGDVRDYGRLDHLVFEGVKTFTQDEMRRAVGLNWELQLASWPSGKLNDYVGTLRRNISFGYNAAGFPDAQVSVGADDEHGTIVVSIVEGERYKAGRVYVTGAKAIPAGRLIEWLTQPTVLQTFHSSTDRDGTAHFDMTLDQPASETLTAAAHDNLWNIGEFANLSPYGKRSISKSLQNGLESLGYFSARFTRSIEFDGNKANLHIDIAEEGPRSTLAGIVFHGLKRVGAGEMQKFLGLQTAMPIGWEKAQEVQRRLYQSGRFRKHLLTARILDGAKLELTIDLEELDGVPPVNQPLSPVDQAALKCRDWILSRSAAGEDLSATLRIEKADGEIKFVVGPGGGAFRFHVDAPATTQPATAPSAWLENGIKIDFGFSMTEKSIRAYDMVALRKMLAIRPGPIQGEIYVRHLFTIEPNGVAKPSVQVGMGTTQSDGIQLDLTLSPAVVLYEIHEKNHPFEIRNGLLICESGKTRVRIDAATGKILEFSLHEGGKSLDLSAGRGRVTPEIDAMEKAVPGSDNFDPKKPVGSAVTFLASTVARYWIAIALPAEQRPSRQTMARILASAMADPIEKVLTRIYPEASDFTIPVSPELSQPRDWIHQFTGKFGFPTIDEMFERGTWPWTLAQQELLLRLGNTESVGDELNRVLREGAIGPVGLLLLTKVIEQINPQAAIQLATQSLKRVDAANFRKDIPAFVHGETGAAQFSRKVADELQRLSPQEARDLADAFPPDQARKVARFIATLQSHKQDGIENALTVALEDLWQDSLQKIVADELEKIARTPPAKE